MLYYHTQLPWEYTTDSPIRNLFYPLTYIGTGASLYKYITHYSTNNIYALFICIKLIPFISTLLHDLLISQLCTTLRYTMQQRTTVLMVYGSVWCTLVLSTHTFSNNLESLLVSFTQLLIIKKYYKLCGIIISIGLFTRVSYIAFIIPVLIYAIDQHSKSFTTLKYIQSALQLAGTMMLSFVPISVLLILADSYYYTTLQSIVITPYNFIKYNTNTANLSLHGTHPYYTHTTINMLILCGPLYIYAIVQLIQAVQTQLSRTAVYPLHHTMATKYMLLASAMSGVFMLSLAPHQEARFCLPAVPILCILCSNNMLYTQSHKTTGENHKPDQSFKLNRATMYLWIVFNVMLASIYGVIHQGGVIRSLVYMNHIAHQHTLPTTIIYYHTYMTPQSLIQQSINSTRIVLYDMNGLQYHSFIPVLKQIKSRHSSRAKIVDSIDSVCSTSLYMIAPGSITFDVAAGLQFDQINVIYPHISFESPPWESDLSLTLYDIMSRSTLNIYCIK